MTDEKKTAGHKVKPKKATKPKSLNVWQRVSAVRGAIQAVAKDKEVGTGSYAYKVATHDAIKAELRPLMATHGLVDYIIEQSYERVGTGVTRGSDAGKRDLLSHQGVYTYRCVNIDDPEDVIEFPVRGDGEDTGDKGTGKSNTYALKAGQKILFQIGTDAGEEAVIPADELTQKGEEYISDAQIDVLMELADELFGADANDVLALMATKFLSVRNVTEIPVRQFEYAVKNLKQKAKGEKIAAEKKKAESVDEAMKPKAKPSQNDSDDIPPLASEEDSNEPESL